MRRPTQSRNKHLGRQPYIRTDTQYDSRGIVTIYPQEGHSTPVDRVHSAPGGVFRPEVEAEGGVHQVQAARVRSGHGFFEKNELGIKECANQL